MSATSLTDVAELMTYFKGDVSDLQQKAQQAQQIVQQAAQAMNQAVQNTANLSPIGTAVQQQSQSISQSLLGISDSIRDLGGELRGVGKDISLMMAPLAGLAGMAAKVGISFDALKQQAMIAFETMLGSAEEAQLMFQELTDFAARTPFTLRGLVPLTQQLLAFGFEGSKIIPMLTSMGDAIAGLGRGEPELQRLILDLGKIEATGHVTGRELRSMATLGIPALQILADTMGKTKTQIQEMVSKGLIPADLAIKALVDGLEKGTANTVAFGGMMDKQSRTLIGILSNLKDTADKTLGTIFQPLVDKATPALLDLQKKLQAFGDTVAQIGLLPALEKFTGLSESFWKVAAAISGVLVVAGPLTFALGVLATAIGALLSPIGLIIVGLAALAAAYATNFDGIKDTIDDFIKTVQDWWSQHGAEVVRITEQIWKRVSEVIVGALEVIGDTILAGSDIMQGHWKDAMDRMGQATETSWTKITKNLLEGLGGLMSIPLEMIGGIMEKILLAINEQFVVMIDVVSGLAKAMGQAMIGNFSGAMSTLNETMNKAWAGIRKGAQYGWEAIVGDAEESVKPLPRIMQQAVMDALPGVQKAGSQVGQAGGLSFVSSFLAQASKAPSLLGSLGLEKPKITPGAVTYDPKKDPMAVAIEKEQAEIRRRQKELEKWKPRDIEIPKVKGLGEVKAALDQFKDGVEGLQSAFDFISAHAADLPGLFDKMGTKARQGSKELVDALKAAASGLTAFYQEAGIKIK